MVVPATATYTRIFLEVSMMVLMTNLLFPTTVFLMCFFQRRWCCLYQWNCCCLFRRWWETHLFVRGNLSSSISLSLNRLSLTFFLQRFERIEDFLKKFFVSKLCSFNLLINNSSIIGTFLINLWPFFVKKILILRLISLRLLLVVGVIVWWPWMFMIEEYA